MAARLQSWRRNLLDSLWCIPTGITVLYVALALLLLRADPLLGLDPRGRDAWAVGGADGARSVLFAIAGTTLSVLGVVFSLTVVVLQIASAQFTPRIMRTLTGDRGTQIVLGVFFGAFAYALLVLRAVRSPGEAGSGPGFVPVAAVAVAIVLALFSIAVMIYYINHVARSVQVAVIIARVTDDALVLLAAPLAAGADRGAGPAAAVDWTPPDGPGARLILRSTGYLQAIDAGTLAAVAAAHQLVVRTDVGVGHFVLAGAPVATIWPAGALDPERAHAMRAAFVVGGERTRQQDVELGLRQLADIAVRALSPAVNDPTTAVMCIDRLGELLVRAAGRPAFAVVTNAAGGQVALTEPSFARLTEVAFTQIRHYGAGDPLVALHLMRMLGAVAARTPADQQPPLVAQAQALLCAARRALVVAADIVRVEAAAGLLGEEEICETTARTPIDRCGAASAAGPG